MGNTANSFLSTQTSESTPVAHDITRLRHQYANNVRTTIALDDDLVFEDTPFKLLVSPRHVRPT